MAEKCLIAATIAVLVCHPSSTIRCFSPKPNDQISPQKHQPKPKPKSKSKAKQKPVSPQKQAQKPLKSEEKLKPNSSFSSTNTSSKEHKPKPKPISPPKDLIPHAKQRPLKSKEKRKPNSSFSSTTNTSSQGLSIKVSEVFQGDSLFGILEKIIRSGWRLDKTRIKVKKVLKVSHSVQTLFMFERHRQKLELKYSKSNSGFNERLAVDGNEILRFHGATITCSLGGRSKGSSSNICKDKLCGVCRILASNFSTEDGSVSFFEKSWEAHQKVNANRVSARKAIVVCRVIAGRIGHCDQHGLMDGEEEGGCDSIVAGSSADHQSNGGKELFVLEPRAVLPCFVVTYSV
ncbi:hypothetical protein TIFTF001_008317 [Ficus carica]|uniref:Uncharacterized protein n=1 Tax=Ficus carica TaxID=3494 RepID=A0AA88A4M0_FICCA|nr:hypothetical protein TIFTF001_008317 [Ficus carica]